MTTEKIILSCTALISALRFSVSITAPISLVLALTACGGGGGSSSTGVPDSSTELSGVVADGYLIGATVCLDTNQNKMCDLDEPQAISGSGGKYSITLNDSADTDASILAEVPDYAIDEDDGAEVGHPYVLYAPAGMHQFISPLTTLVQLLMENNPALTIDEAESIVMEAIGYYDEDNISAFDDYVDAEDDENSSADEYTRIHNIARILVKVMSQNYVDIFSIESMTEIERLEFYNNISHLIIEHLNYIIDEIDISEGNVENIDMETLLDKFTVISLLNIDVTFGDNLSWSGTWNGGATDGVTLDASDIQFTINDGIIYSDSGTIDASFYGSNTEFLSGLVDITKRTEVYEEVRYVDTFITEAD